METKTVFISIGVENSPIAMAEKIATIVYEDETEIQVAKQLRKKFADTPYFHGYSIDQKPFKPSHLWFTISYEVDGANHTWSGNTPEKFR